MGKARRKKCLPQKHLPQRGREWGAPCDLPLNRLPTHKHVAQLFLKLIVLNDHDQVNQMIVDQVKEKWLKANPNIPLLQDYAIMQKVQRFTERVKKSRSKMYTAKDLEWIDKNIDTLFELSKCRCKLPLLPCDDRRIRCSKKICEVNHYYCECNIHLNERVSNKVNIPRIEKNIFINVLCFTPNDKIKL